MHYSESVQPIDDPDSKPIYILFIHNEIPLFYHKRKLKFLHFVTKQNGFQKIVPLYIFHIPSHSGIEYVILQI